MLYEYGGWIIDATPDHSPGIYFAHARLTCASSHGGEEPEMHIEHDIAWFESEEPAIQCAHLWAMTWIDEREGRSPARNPDPVSFAMPSHTTQAG
ncbi:hypothetical protein ACFPTO_17270 [Paraburkholderia denitrificans]|uniref:Uncharacterized protein n=1 Tax=Paraburkholderia denitrificans TaxID=694025 RepID=A0ABW0JC17_9BURK